MRSPSSLFAGLHQLLWPVLDRADDLPGVQGAALRGAFGLTAERVEDRFLVSVVVLGLLTTVAEDGPLLCVFDDAHWLDQPSADALRFAARRLRGRPGCAAARVARRRRATVRGRGLPELRVAGLAPADAAALLDATTRLPETVRHQLMEVTHGNPLALLELPRGLTDDQRAGRTPLVGDVTLSAEIEQAFLAQIRPLPAATQRLLLLAAADDSAEIGTVLGAAERLGLGGRARRGRARRAPDPGWPAAALPASARAVRGLWGRNLERAARGSRGARRHARRRARRRPPRLAPRGRGDRTRRGGCRRAGAHRGRRA